MSSVKLCRAHVCENQVAIKSNKIMIMLHDMYIYPQTSRKLQKRVGHSVWQDTKICQTERKSVSSKQVEQKQSKNILFILSP